MATTQKTKQGSKKSSAAQPGSKRAVPQNAPDQRHPRPSRANAPEAPPAAEDSPPLSACGLLYCAAESFIRDNAYFESSIPVNEALGELGRCATLEAAFAVPLQHKLFAMDTALLWLLFLRVAPGHAVEEGDKPFSAAAPFDAAEALSLLTQVYDLGVQDAVWGYFAEEYTGESEDDALEEPGEDAQ